MASAKQRSNPKQQINILKKKIGPFQKKNLQQQNDINKPLLMQ